MALMLRIETGIRGVLLTTGLALVDGGAQVTTAGGICFPSPFTFMLLHCFPPCSGPVRSQALYGDFG